MELGQGVQSLTEKAAKPHIAGGGRARDAWRRWAPAAVALAAALLAASYFGAPYLFGPVVTTAKVERRDIVQTVVASGQIQTPYRVAVSSQITGVVADVPVAEGQDVKAGDLIIALDDADAREQVKSAQAAVDQAEARLKQLTGVQAPAAEQNLKQAQANLTDAHKTSDRAKTLLKQGFATQQTVDDAQKAFDVAQSQVTTATIQYDTFKTGGFDYLLSQTQLTQAEANLRAAQAQLGYTQIRAPREGTLITRNVERGQVVQAGKDLMDLAPAGQTQIVAQIDERNLSLLRLGEPAQASADAYPQQKFAAKVIYINPSVDATTGSIQTKLSVAEPPAFLRQDMTVSVEIEAARRPSALVADASAVRDISSAKPWALVAENGRAVRRDVKLGAIGDKDVEILSGAAEGDRLIKTSNGQIATGQRVRLGSDE